MFICVTPICLIINIYRLCSILLYITFCNGLCPICNISDQEMYCYCIVKDIFYLQCNKVFRKFSALNVNKKNVSYYCVYRVIQLQSRFCQCIDHCICALPLTLCRHYCSSMCVFIQCNSCSVLAQNMSLSVSQYKVIIVFRFSF